MTKTINLTEHPQLKEVYNKPKKAYYKGDLGLLQKTCISVVGTRQFSEYGEYMTNKIIRELASLDCVIVSGLARGIDTIAHKAALANGLPTIAVLGSGIDNIYPAENAKLAEKIEHSGLILSEYEGQTQPTKYTFPTRNRIIAGLSVATIIIEAPTRSGALHTAKLALDDGRSVFAVPGDADRENSHGTNSLIKQGAALVTSGYDVIEDLQIQPSLQFSEEPQTKIKLKLSPLEKNILEKIPKARGTTTESLAATSQIEELLSTLSMLELKGLITNRDGKYRRIR